MNNILDLNETNYLLCTGQMMSCVDLFTGAVSSIPVTGGVVAGFVTVPIFDPGSWAAFGTVGDRPGEIHLQGGEVRTD